MPKPIVRADSHALATQPGERSDMARTITEYRRIVRMLATVLMVHWPEIQAAKNRCNFIESLFHFTAKRPHVRYPVLDRALGKMPSYLRRAAIEAACGVVSSFLSNWDNFLAGEIGGKPRDLGCRPPRMGFSNVYPPLYGGKMIEYGVGLRTVRIKLLRADGTWAFSRSLAVKGRFKRLQPLAGKMDMCPTLVLKGARRSLCAR